MGPEDNLPQPFREALECLRRRHCPGACVAASDGNFALVDLGEGPPPEGYRETSVHAYARVPLDIRNAEPYGVVTVPPLTRKDGQPIGHQHLSHPNAAPIVRPGITAAFWSWDWKNMGRRGPEDLAHAYEWAWKCLRDGAQ